AVDRASSIEYRASSHMSRVLLLIIALAVAAFAGWYYWNLSQRISSAPVSALLPRETIFLAHMPSFNQTREDWHHCDIYQLYGEAAVMDFLRFGIVVLVFFLISKVL